ncbi:DUF6069 family protein [Micromonospora sp. DR5-3]|uniref:DUF6069 family protein n=1 Tax=unclassified Micromonospora TaxID=2617518 RepID=UPI0011D41C00|nr:MULTISPECIES: DUF6069 family protein [unclassified Micromonospora]MCW3815086.1 DUF6069 family protein [Micromonospora sp. DR5-3]TYC25397.1 hypothetical protein FXF52_06275 [Micromonospora sp. MP36]
MTTTTSPIIAAARPTARTVSAASRRRRRRALGVAAAVGANSLLYLVARAAGVDFTLTDPGSTQAHPLILPEIAVFSLVFGLLGWGALALLERVTRHARPIWGGLAGTVLAASFVPIFIERATVDTRLMLCVLHVVVAAALLPMLRPAGTAAR